MGGLKRAAILSPERRREIALQGVAAKREIAAAREELNKLPKATHEGELDIGGTIIACAVLEGGKRVITQSGFMVALGRARQAKGRQYYDADVNLPAFLTAKNLKPFIPKELSVTSSQIEFKMLSGKRAFGYSADLLPLVCGVFLDAKAAGDVLTHNQEPIAERALMLIRGLAHIGIIALVDEATGFQYDRPRRDLEEQLKKFLSDSLRRWVRTFPASYFKHLCRLRGVELRPDMRLPQYFGHLTNNLVYRRLAPGLVKKLKERRSDLGGENSHNLHSLLSADFGFPEVLIHLGTVIGVMKQHTKYEEFERALDDVAPIYPEIPGLFDDPKDWDPR